MCGIIGVIGHNKVSSLLIEGLKRLEYRGYDSAGIATLLNGKIDRRRSLGKIENLKKSSGEKLCQSLEDMGTTFINTVDISELDIENGGRTNYTIKVDKRDAQDRIYMHITGKDGNTSVFSGTDILSESGVASGFQEYEGGFDFSGSITKSNI